MATHYMHVDVFSARPYSGNSLAVFPDSAGLTADQMLRITQELRHFETVFFKPTGNASTVRARVFDLFEELYPELPPQVVSTGLRYLIVPVARGALGRARIRHDITSLLSSIGAQFAVLFDEVALEIRHWNNDGIAEDVATGSAAGTIGAYRLRHGLARGGETFILHQGRYVGRPSALRIQPEGTAEAIRTVKVGGDVALVGHGTLDVLP